MLGFLSGLSDDCSSSDESKSGNLKKRTKFDKNKTGIKSNSNSNSGIQSGAMGQAGLFVPKNAKTALGAPKYIDKVKKIYSFFLTFLTDFQSYF
jgi:hypothetical protein